MVTVKKADLTFPPSFGTVRKIFSIPYGAEGGDNIVEHVGWRRLPWYRLAQASML